MALLAAGEVMRFGGLRESADRRAAVARDLEASMMCLPTGIQDHLPAQLGGALAIEHRPGGARVRRLAVDLEELAEHWIVAYTGQSHFSAANNWQVLRRRFEGDPGTVARLDDIRSVTEELPPLLERSGWMEVGKAVAREWKARRGLAPEVSTPRLESLLELGREHGAWGGKACGAGGGGSILFVVPADRRAEISRRLSEAGAVVLDAAPTAEGLVVSEEPT